MPRIHGSCLCGGVEFEIAGPLMAPLNCHCPKDAALRGRSPPPPAWHQCAVYSGNGNPAGKNGVGNGEKDAQEGCCESAEETKNLDQEEKRGDEKDKKAAQGRGAEKIKTRC